MDEFKDKSNSFKTRAKKKSSEEPKKVQKIVTGEVHTKKRSGVRKLADIFLPEDVNSIKNHVIYDVIIPAAKKIISDTVDTYLYGENSTNRKTNTSSKVSYENSYVSALQNKSYNKALPLRKSYLFDEISFVRRGDAEAVLVQMDELIDTYGFATVADLYDLSGITTGSYVDNNWGWSDIRTAQVVRDRDGFLLKFPKAKPID